MKTLFLLSAILGLFSLPAFSENASPVKLSQNTGPNCYSVLVASATLNVSSGTIHMVDASTNSYSSIDIFNDNSTTTVNTIFCNGSSTTLTASGTARGWPVAPGSSKSWVLKAGQLWYCISNAIEAATSVVVCLSK